MGFLTLAEKLQRECGLDVPTTQQKSCTCTYVIPRRRRPRLLHPQWARFRPSLVSFPCISQATLALKFSSCPTAVLTAADYYAQRYSTLRGAQRTSTSTRRSSAPGLLADSQQRLSSDAASARPPSNVLTCHCLHCLKEAIARLHSV